MNDETTVYKEVRGLARGLEVLVALNANAKRQVSISSLSEATKLHRTTVKRLLETLRQHDYLDYDEMSHTYSLRLNVKRLSAGYVDDEWMTEVAGPVLQKLSAKSIWPTNLVTFDLDAMLIRKTSYPRNLVIVDGMMLGMRVPILFTAAGRAFLFACSDEKRRAIIGILAKKHDEEGFMARDTRRMKDLRDQIDEIGCAFMARAWKEHPNRSAIAVPIKHNNEALGSITMIFHAQAISIPEAVKNYSSILKEAAAEIADRMNMREI